MKMKAIVRKEGNKEAINGVCMADVMREYKGTIKVIPYSQWKQSKRACAFLSGLDDIDKTPNDWFVGVLDGREYAWHKTWIFICTEKCDKCKVRFECITSEYWDRLHEMVL